MRPALLLLGLVAAIDLSAGNWPQFRGPQASGVDTNAPVPTGGDDEKGETIRWRAPLPGLAHASPIIWNDRVYVTTATRSGKADLKVGLYGDIDSADDGEEQEWRLQGSKVRGLTETSCTLQVCSKIFHVKIEP